MTREMTEKDHLHLLRIYLRDHEAAAVGGLRLFSRCSNANRGTAYAADLQRLTSDVRADRDELRSICRTFRVRFSNLERALAFSGAVLGGLKPNGRAFTYSPMSRVVELEALSAGVMSKLRMWESLLLLAESEPRLSAPDMARLARDAKEQLNALTRLHAIAADEAFATPDHESFAHARQSPARTTV